MLVSHLAHRALRLIAISLTLFVLLLIALPQLGYPFWFDQGAFAACADVLRRGGALYRDCWDVRGPLTVFAYALPRLLSPTPMAVMAFDLLCAAGTSVLISGLTIDLFTRTKPAYVLSDRAGKTLLDGWVSREAVPGIIAGALYWLMYASLNYWSVAQAEGFANVLLVAAVWLTWRAIQAEAPTSRRTLAQFVLAGACAGLAFWSKYPFGALALVLAGFIAIHAPQRWRSVALFGAGVLAALLLGLAYFAVNGALDALQTHVQYAWFTFHALPLSTRWAWLTQFFAPEVVEFAKAGSTPTAGFKDTIPQVELLGRGYPFVLILAVIGAASMLLRPRRLRPNLLATGYALLYLAATLAITVWEGHFYRYHFIIVLPALAVLAGGAFAYSRLRETQHQEELRSSASGRVSGSRFFPLTPLLSALAIAGFVATMLPWFQDAYTNFVLQRKSSRQIYLESELANDVLLAEFLQANTAADEPVLIFSDTPAVYALAQRPNATRFVYFRWVEEAGSDAVRRTLTGQFVNEWRASRPRYVILTKDGFPWPQAHFGEVLKRIPEADDYFQAHYEYVNDVGSYVVFKWVG